MRDRAGNRCEYCRIHQQHYIITFHIEHIVAQQHHGGSDEANLVLACHFCNRHKRPNLAGMDPTTGELKYVQNLLGKTSADQCAPFLDTEDVHDER